MSKTYRNGVQVRAACHAGALYSYKFGSGLSIVFSMSLSKGHIPQINHEMKTMPAAVRNQALPNG